MTENIRLISYVLAGLAGICFIKSLVILSEKGGE